MSKTAEPENMNETDIERMRRVLAKADRELLRGPMRALQAIKEGITLHYYGRATPRQVLAFRDVFQGIVDRKFKHDD